MNRKLLIHSYYFILLKIKKDKGIYSANNKYLFYFDDMIVSLLYKTTAF